MSATVPARGVAVRLNRELRRAARKALPARSRAEPDREERAVHGPVAPDHVARPSKYRPPQPSFAYKHYEALRVRQLLAQQNVKSPEWQLNGKDAGYRFARSHGVDTPKIIAEYANEREIDWGSLPDEFVLKTVDGTSSRGVMPLVREGDAYLDQLNLAAPPLRPSEIVERFDTLRTQKRIKGAVMIEELVWSTHPGPRTIAPDVKLYCFYGAVGLIMVRDANGTRATENNLLRYFDTSGVDLGDAIEGRIIHASVPAPRHLDALIEAGCRLSGAIPVPFARLDFLERPSGILFGEVTYTPGGRQQPRPDLDRALGELWEDAESRLRIDEVKAGLRDPLFGDRDFNSGR